MSAFKESSRTAKLGVTNRKLNRLNSIFQSKIDAIEEELKEMKYKHSEGDNLIVDVSRKIESSE